jgi:LacI family transcriptional regulator
MSRKKTEGKSESISLRELARLAGVSPATVSLAMRESPRLAQATKDRIRKIAKEHGYMPNPRLSRILSETVSSRYHRRGGLIYLIITRYSPQTWNPENPWFVAMAARCRELGYTLEPFWIFGSGMTASRANKIMYSRGVEGLIIHPPPYEFRDGEALTLPIDWEKFCVVEIDDVITDPILHHVRHDHLSGIWLALQETEALGYRRIGLCLWTDLDFATHHRWTAGYTYWAATRGLEGPIRSPFLYDKDPRSLRKWVRSCKLDAVIGPSRETFDAIVASGLKIPEDVAFVALDVEFESSILSSPAGSGDSGDLSEQAAFAGIFQCRLEQHLLAADMLVSLITRGARGVPKVSSAWILAGTWQPGASCPPKSGKQSPSLSGEKISPHRKLPKVFQADSGTKTPLPGKNAEIEPLQTAF